MIVELVDEAGQTIGRFQAPAIPRPGEQVSYANERYAVEDVTWIIETRHNQNIETVRLVVTTPDT